MSASPRTTYSVAQRNTRSKHRYQLKPSHRGINEFPLPNEIGITNRTRCYQGAHAFFFWKPDRAIFFTAERSAVAKLGGGVHALFTRNIT